MCEVNNTIYCRPFSERSRLLWPTCKSYTLHWGLNIPYLFLLSEDDLPQNHDSCVVKQKETQSPCFIS